MKFVLPRGQKWFLAIVGVIFLLYQGYHLWSHRDITWNWKEEAQLADGSRIWVDRGKVIEVRGGGEPFTSSRGVKTNQIIIPGEQGVVVWKFPLAPMILERGEASDRWVVIASPLYCEDHYRYGSPKPPYVQFDYVNGKWTYKHVDPKWYGKRANLLGDYENTYEQQAKRVGKSFTAEQIRGFNNQIYDAAKEQIVVDANYKSNCH